VTEPRATAVNADRYPTEAEARSVLAECDTDLPYLGVWQPPGQERIHLFARDVTAEQYEANGWTREGA
jgi:hypothetical protein